MKLLPNCHAADPRDPRTRPFWEELARLRMPFIAHTGGENLVHEPRRDLRDPRVHIPALEAGATVIAAHCATSSAFVDRNLFGEFAAMLRRFPNFWGDISALGLPNRVLALRRCLAPAISSRVVHGSDVPVPIFAFPAFLGGLYSFREYRRIRRIANPLERDLQVKLACGFPREVFTRVESLFPPTAKARAA
jgi:predicted TIM-barrel fold metal-dependent hydrolase